MNNQTKTMMLILTAILLLVSVVMTTIFHNLRTRIFDDDRDRIKLRNRMRFCIIIMTMVLMSLVIMSRYILIRYYMG
ncbi:MAG: hypothetical protein IJG49_08190 [Erysipelotrichaceae bacterium]|nr:hypothetical protein [Erysipelotrichaceae bacterium]